MRPKIFDVLIVYTESLARSASDLKYSENKPFPAGSRSETYNLVYSYFLEACEKINLKVGFTTSADIIGAGTCKSYWSYKNNTWHKNIKVSCANLIFDKFSPTKSIISKRRKLLFSSDKVKPFNHPELFNIFFDKLKTYQTLSEYSIPTMCITDRDTKSVSQVCKSLAEFMNTHPGSDDFSSDIILKDRFGAGGRHIYKFKSGEVKSMAATIRKNNNVSFVVQPFAKFDLGFTYLHSPASTDIRFIYLKGRIVQSYIRQAKKGDFRCNEHRGGSLNYLALRDIPQNLVAKSKVVAKSLNKDCSLYALDFIISNNGNAYLLEGNTGPGLDWNILIKKNEFQSKKLIRLIARDLKVRSNI